MNIIKIVAIAIIVSGVLGLVYGHFSYSKEIRSTKMGPIDVAVKEKQTVNVPVWVGVGAIAIGSLFLLLAGRS